MNHLLWLHETLSAIPHSCICLYPLSQHGMVDQCYQFWIPYPSKNLNPISIQKTRYLIQVFRNLLIANRAAIQFLNIVYTLITLLTILSFCFTGLGEASWIRSARRLRHSLWEVLLSILCLLQSRNSCSRLDNLYTRFGYSWSHWSPPGS